LQASENQVLLINTERKLYKVAIEPSRQFKNLCPSNLDQQLERAKIRNLNADSAKEIQEVQSMIMARYGSKSPSKPVQKL